MIEGGKADPNARKTDFVLPSKVSKRSIGIQEGYRPKWFIWLRCLSSFSLYLPLPLSSPKFSFLLEAKSIDDGLIYIHVRSKTYPWLPPPISRWYVLSRQRGEYHFWLWAVVILPFGSGPYFAFPPFFFFFLSFVRVQDRESLWKWGGVFYWERGWGLLIDRSGVRGFHWKIEM